MRPKKATPEEGAKIDREHFVNYTPKCGISGSVSGWCACEPWWGICHDYHEDHGPTKVCLDWFTDSALYCERCRRQPATERLAYCLWWRGEDGAPLLTICRNTVAPLLDGLRYGTAIYCAKVDKFSSNYLKASGSAQKFVPNHPLRQKEVEILPTLLMVWKLPQLDKWCKEQDHAERYRELNALEPGQQTLSVPPPTTKIEGQAIAAHRRFGHLGDDAVDEAIKKIVVRKDDAEKNGKHKKGGS